MDKDKEFPHNQNDDSLESVYSDEQNQVQNQELQNNNKQDSYYEQTDPSDIHQQILNQCYKDIKQITRQRKLEMGNNNFQTNKQNIKEYSIMNPFEDEAPSENSPSNRQASFIEEEIKINDESYALFTQAQKIPQKEQIQPFQSKITDQKRRLPSDLTNFNPFQDDDISPPGQMEPQDQFQNMMEEEIKVSPQRLNNFMRSENNDLLNYGLESIIQNVKGLSNMLQSRIHTHDQAGLSEEMQTQLNKLKMIQLSLSTIVSRLESRTHNNVDEELGQLKEIITGCMEGDSQMAFRFLDLLIYLNQLQNDKFKEALLLQSQNQIGEAQLLQSLIQTPIKKKLNVYLIFVQPFLNAINFFKNPDNILKCLVLSVFLLFFSSYLSMPVISDKPVTYIFDWLAYNKNSKNLIVFGTISFMTFAWFITRFIWVFIMGDITVLQEKRIRNNLMECNPILHISIIYMTDPSIIDNKLDLVIWGGIFFVYACFQVFQLEAFQELKAMIANIESDYSLETAYVARIKKFALIMFLLNLIFSGFGLWLFWNAGFYILSLLFFGGAIFFIDNFKIILILLKLQENMYFYINNNTDEINEPFYNRELFMDTIYHLVCLFHYSQLIINYFLKQNYQFIMHLWILYLFKELQISFATILKNYNSFMRFRKIKNNLDQIFPKVYVTELNKEEICSICHEELLIARRLVQCGHKFHIKCLFHWLKNQKVSKCPICRNEIKDLNNNMNEIPNGFWRLLNFLINFQIGGISIHFITIRQQPLDQNIGENAQN